MMEAFQKQCLAPTSQSRSLLIVEDDRRLTQCLARGMEARGFNVATAESVLDGLAQIKLSAPEYAVVDMRLETGVAWMSFQRLNINDPTHGRSF